MNEFDEGIDWSKTTFEGSSREQLRRWLALTVLQRLEALDALSDLAHGAGAFNVVKAVTGAGACAEERLDSGVRRNDGGVG